MKYNSINEWLDNGAPEVYDFVEDTQEGNHTMPERDFGEIKDEYRRFFTYKLNTTKEYFRPRWNILEKIGSPAKREAFMEEKERFLDGVSGYQVDDPDVGSDLLQEIYDLLWGELTAQPFMRQTLDTYQRETGEEMEEETEKKMEKGIAASDTMTSAMVRFADAMKLVIDKDHPAQAGVDPVISSIQEIYGACEQGQRWWSVNFSIIVEAALGGGLGRLADSCYPSMRKFLSMTHTIGNYCPVPVEFNGARSGHFASHDYWDLTLMKIHDWYMAAEGTAPEEQKKEEQDRMIRELMHDRGNHENCRKWLSYFGAGSDGWHHFVDTLYMQDYVDKNYSVKPFWKGHGWDSTGLPQDQDAVDKGLAEIVRRIVARAGRIVRACSEKLV